MTCHFFSISINVSSRIPLYFFIPSNLNNKIHKLCRRITPKKKKIVVEAYSVHLSFSFSHIFRQGNALALALAKRARISFRMFAWMESVPPDLYDYNVVDFLAINLIKQTCLSSKKEKRKKKAYFVHLSFIKIKNYVGGIYICQKGVLSIVKLRLVY